LVLEADYNAGTSKTRLKPPLRRPPPKAPWY